MVLFVFPGVEQHNNTPEKMSKMLGLAPNHSSFQSPLGLLVTRQREQVNQAQSFSAVSGSPWKHIHQDPKEQPHL